FLSAACTFYLYSVLVYFSPRGCCWIHKATMSFFFHQIWMKPNFNDEHDERFHLI
ncbi:hypothetical protein ALC53_06109, partial [Atta colombica]